MTEVEMGFMKLGPQAKRKASAISRMMEGDPGWQLGSGPGGQVKRLQERVLQVNEICRTSFSSWSRDIASLGKC